MVFPRRNLRKMLLTCEKAMNFVMKERCIDVDTPSLRVAS